MAQPQPPTWTGQNVRDAFIRFYKEHDHLNIPSSSVVPHEDPTLLFTNAGMNQFKPIFLGTVDPKSEMATWKRVANSQKCIRAGGKHNDLDDVGKDTYHHTFFEMLGTWSFGNYFKAESIDWGVELLTRVYGIDKNFLYASYFGGDRAANLPPDEEAKQIWLKHLPPERVLPFGMKENFWEMGETGPCGPSSEIHYDRLKRPSSAAAALVNADDPTVIEIWNHVFIQFNREADGKLRPLPAKHVDTGMGLERLTSILQERMSNYDTDFFTFLFQALSEATGTRPYQGRLGKDDADCIDMAYRVVADHIRTLTFAVNDGAYPGSEGRNYVIRRILRRAVRFGRQILNATPGFFSRLVPLVVEKMCPAFPELRKNPDHIVAVLRKEEELFGRTIDRGINKFKRLADLAEKGNRTISGRDAFVLSDTYGFPLDLTVLMADERRLKVDQKEFARLLDDARERSKTAAAGLKTAVQLDPNAQDELKKGGIRPTDDSAKYVYNEQGVVPDVEATVKAIFDGSEFLDSINEGPTVGIVLDVSNFYAEAGGQIYDEGSLAVLGRDVVFDVTDVQSFQHYVLHLGAVQPGKGGEVKVGDRVRLHVEPRRRLDTMANHTATHLVNWALRGVLDGHEIEQRGSQVLPERFRFDFSFERPLTLAQLEKVDALVNELVDKNLLLYHKDVQLAQAKQIHGVRAVFGETYPDPVRVVSVGVPVDDLLKNPSNPEWFKYPIEFCGGTHLSRTGTVARFVITSQESLGAGVRRINVVTGERARQAEKEGAEFAQRLQAVAKMPDDKSLEPAVLKLLQELQSIEKPLIVPARMAVQFHHSLEQLLERIKQVNKSERGSDVKHAEQFAARAIDSIKEHPVRFFVSRLDVGGNADALRVAADQILKAFPQMGVLLLSPDPKATDKKKVLIHCQVANELTKQLAAGQWAAEVARVMDGKGGGSPKIANSYGSDPSKIEQALQLAAQYAQGKLSG